MPADWLTDFVAWLAASPRSAGTVGTNLFRFAHPDNFSPTTLVAVVGPTGGSPYSKSIGVDFPTAQILHRCKTAQTAWDEAWRLYHILKDSGPARMGSTAPYSLIQSIQALQAPFVLGRDPAGALLVACNYELDLVAE